MFHGKLRFYILQVRDEVILTELLKTVNSVISATFPVKAFTTIILNFVLLFWVDYISAVVCTLYIIFNVNDCLWNMDIDLIYVLSRPCKGVQKTFI